MNNLSWLLYLSDVADNLCMLFGMLLTCSVVVYFVYAALYVIGTHRFPKVLWPIWIIVCLSIVSVFIPSKSTVMMIAASQAGEQFAKTPAVNNISKKALDAINTYLDNYNNNHK